ncbi:MAG: aminotransferase class V-fold PLP-dependent enzyme [Planctomycetaceae bacterium]|nr:aminotransferase class V-fold PLP-dependent enzyme [Planctomycetaceae bacterium]
MPSLVYLDWARLGPMSPAAQRAQLDFVRLAAEEPSSLYFEQFLRDGFSHWPSAYQQRFSGLSSWPGVLRLKTYLRQLAQAPDDWKVLLASRSLSLIKLATQCLFRVCGNVLTTDLNWPTYQQAVGEQAARSGSRVSTASLRDGILYRGRNEEEIARYLAETFVAQQCDGLFLPVVDHLGIRLPIRHIIERIQQQSEVRFVLLDASQAFCHVPLADSVAVADFVVAGSHKWMGASLPTGIGFYGDPRSGEMIQDQICQCRRTGRLDDPLWQFSEQLSTGNLDGHSETANLTNLFACAGAASDQQVRNASPLASAAEFSETHFSWPASLGEWRPVLPASPLRTRIRLIESRVPEIRQWSADAIRLCWLKAGIVVSAYPGGRVRLSAPPELCCSFPMRTAVC